MTFSKFCGFLRSGERAHVRARERFGTPMTNVGVRPLDTLLLLLISPATQFIVI
jgi:hypothetical protein